MSGLDDVVGDLSRLPIPSHPDALLLAGPEFLTRAFRAFGTLGGDNAVDRIVSAQPCPGGSTGVKLFLDVAYAAPDAALPTQLFAKFSRDFSDERRDAIGRWEMAEEARFAWLARQPGFPVAVPRPMFADYDMASGTGLIITGRVAFGEAGIEPHREKCFDYRTLDDPLPHYRAIVRALARLAAAHKAGRLGPEVDRLLPYDAVRASPDPIQYNRSQLRAELDTCFAFARDCPRLLPPELRSADFLAKMERDTWQVFEHEAEIRRFLVSDPRLIALCHWNAHIDNCWFETDAAGELQCGFIDWGRVGQLTLGSVLWGGLSAAHHAIWDTHLDELLGLFVSGYAAHGGPEVSVAELKQHLLLHIALMGVARVLAFPEIIRFRLPECMAASGPRDAMFDHNEPARNCLHVYTVFLKLWQRAGFGAAMQQLPG